MGIKENKDRIDRLETAGGLEKEEWVALLASSGEPERAYAAERAREISNRFFGRRIYIRGLIEFTSHCCRDCYYCGLRRSNEKAERYRLSKEAILDCCEAGYRLGFRTFVLQGGEDGYFTEERVLALIEAIKGRYPDCALTLSIGEWPRASCQAFYEAGADRYLLRHETADAVHYGRLHPPEQSLESRLQCLQSLKETGFQTGCGFMVGSPGQTVETLAEDMLLISRLHPQMAGIGPFLPHKDTPFGKEKAGSLELTLYLLSLLRIMEKNILLPATTALGTVHEKGREMGVLAGANVVMPNLSPVGVRRKYSLYDNKICTGEEAAECIGCLKRRMESIGYEIVTDRGDWQAQLNLEKGEKYGNR